MKNKKLNISIIGAGSWGGTLAYLLSKKGQKVTLWTQNTDEYLTIKKTRTLTKPIRYKLNKNIDITLDLKSIVNNSDIILIAVPTNAFEEVVTRLKELNIDKSTIIVSATKGITTDKCKRPSKILKEILPKNPIAILSGPNIAIDILANTPIISVIATKEIESAKLLQKVLSSDFFRIYINKDIDGVEVAGALKNVIAIAAGISDGLGFSISTKAALISRGLIEIAKITTKEGGEIQTLLGAAGIGDLIATCCSTNSRNYRVGYQLAKGKKLNTIIKELGQVAEGVETVKSMNKLAKRYKLNLPISSSVYRILIKGEKTQKVLKELVTRPLANQELDF